MFNVQCSKFNVSSSSESRSQRSTSSSRAFFVDVYSVTSFMSDAFSGFISSSSSSALRCLDCQSH